MRPGDAGVDFRREGTVRLCQGSRLELEAQDTPPGGLASGNGSRGFDGQPVPAACSKASGFLRRYLLHHVTHRGGLGGADSWAPSPTEGAWAVQIPGPRHPQRGLGRCRFLGPVSKLMSCNLCG